MATSRSIDTESITLRNLYIISTNNVPYSSQTLSVVGKGGLLQWLSPDSWMNSIYFSSFGGRNLSGLLQYTDPPFVNANISTVVQGILNAAPYITLNTLNLAIFNNNTQLQTNTIPSIVQRYFGGCNVRGTLGYRTYTSTFTPLQPLGSFVQINTGVNEAIACISSISLLGFSTLRTDNSRLRLESPNYIFVSTSRIDPPNTFTLSHQLLVHNTGIQVCRSIDHTFTGSVKTYTYPSLTWNITNTDMRTKNVFSTLDYCVVATSSQPFTMYTEICVSPTGVFATLDNTFNGSYCNM